MGAIGGKGRALLVVAVLASIAAGCSDGGSKPGGQAGTAAAKEATARIEEDLPSEISDEGEVGFDVYGSDGEAVALHSIADGRIVIRRSDDGGRTWRSVTLPGDDYRDPSTTWLRQAGGTFLVIAKTGRGGEIEPGDDATPDVAVRSTDGGSTWTRTKLPDLGGELWNPYSIATAATDDHLVITGAIASSTSRVAGWVSDDDGAHWKPLQVTAGKEPPRELARVSAYDGAIRLWGKTRKGIEIVATSDGGKTWTKEAAPKRTSDDLFDHVDIAGAWWSVPVPELGEEASDGNDDNPPKLRRSLDDGATWDAVAVGTTACAPGVEVPRHRISTPVQAGGLLVVVTACVDDSGAIDQPRRDVWASGDGGETWSQVEAEGRSIDPVYSGSPGFSSFGEAWLAANDGSDRSTVVDPFHRSAGERKQDRAGVKGSRNVRPPEANEVLEPVAGTWYRFSVLGYGDDGGGLDLTVLEDGTVISAGGRRVYKEAYTTVTLTPEALDELIGWIRSTDLIGMPNDDHHDGWDGSSFSYGDGLVVEPVPDDIAERLADLSWLGDGVSEPEQWLPDQIGVEISQYEPAEDGPTRREPVQDWPLDRPVELTGRDEGDPLVPGGTTVDGDVEYGWVCVDGDDAAALFGLMVFGIGDRHIRVDDGSGKPWEVSLEPIVAGRALSGSPCE